MDGQRLLKIISTEDNNEVTLLLPSSIQEEPCVKPSQNQEGLQQIRNTTLGNVQNQSNVHQHLKGTYQRSPQVSNQYQTNVQLIGQYPPKCSQYQRGQGQGQFQQGQAQGQYQQGQSQGHSSQYQFSVNKPLLSTATRVNQSSSVWTEKDLSSWQPKLTSGKWLQQHSLQQRTDTFSREDEINESVAPIFTPDKIENSVASIFPIKLARSSSIAGVTKTGLSSSSQNLGNTFSVQTQTTDIPRWDSTYIPINLSTAVPINQSSVHSSANSMGRPSSFTAFETSRNTQTSNALTSPVYKSKLEKAVEQNQNAGMTASSNNSSKLGQGTLKKLLISDIADLDALRIFPTVEAKPQVNIYTDQENQMNQNSDQEATLNKSVKKESHDRSKFFLKKKDVLLEKPQMDKSERQFKMPTSAGTSINQESYPYTIVQPSVNVGLALSQLEQQLQNKEHYTDSQIAGNHKTIDQKHYKDSVKDMDGFESTQPGVTCDGIPKVTGIYSTMIPVKVITQKEYSNPKWSNRVTEEQWRLREEGLFCDALFHCKTEKFKFHRVVMSAVSPDFLNRDHKYTDEIQLELPLDILYENVYLFMKFVYLGKIELTVNNVQQIYRLSTLFDITDLNRYCYDFCKIAKLGHLIISSPYQETALQVSRPQDKIQDGISENEPSIEISDVRTVDQMIDVFTAKPQNQNVNPQSSEIDFDWLTSDPDQSNIPIRKRGRTRHKVNVSSEISGKSTKMPSAVDKTINGQINSLVETSRNSCNNSYEKATNDRLSTTAVNTHLDEHKMMLEHQSKSGNLNETETTPVKADDLSLQLSELPDPLATGKFDESQLINHGKPASKNHKEVSSVSKPPRKTMVTRYRGRPKTMTVLEAASRKKAKYDIPLGMSSSRKAAKDKSLQRKTVKVLKSKPKPVERSKLDKRKTINEGITMNDITEAEKEARERKIQNRVKPMENTGSEQCLVTSIPNLKTSKIVPAKKRQGPSKEWESKDKDTVANLKEKLDGFTEPLQIDGTAEDVSLPKKPRLRKTTLDQQQEAPVKDPVYMRPPKKRTKEIREMMKIEADKPELQQVDLLVDKKLTNSDAKHKMIVGKYKGLAKAHPLVSKEIKQKQPTKSKMLTSAAILKVVCEVEQFGKVIDGEKQYRCCLCNSVFVFSKRVITHIVNTHDISLENTVEYIDVEHKKPQSKKCDICGYVTKELNIYYIHFHKYFKHGVPLPKGWQPFRCDLCKKEFFTKFQLREHKLIHFEDNPFVCELCGNGFKSRTGLNSHMFHKHSSVRNHKCPDCIKTFKTRTQMKVHQRTHTGEKPFACRDTKCNYRSTTRGNMKLHLLNRHKYTVETVSQIMKELNSSIEETSNTDLDETPVDLWEQVQNEVDENQSDIQVKMEAFDVNHAAFETLVGAAAEIANSDKGFITSSMTNEQVNKPSTSINGQVQTIADQIMVQIVDSNKVNYSIHENLPDQPDRNLKISDVHNTQNLPRHVELLMENPNLPDSQLIMEDGPRQVIREFHGDPVDLPHCVTDNNVSYQVTRSQGTGKNNQDDTLDSFIEQQKFRPLSREVRMPAKHTYQNADKTPLFKTGIQSSESEFLFRNIDGQALQTQPFDGSLSIQTSSAPRDQIIAENQIIHDLRQVQGQSHFNAENQNIYRVEITPQSNVSPLQQESSSQRHLPAIQQDPVSPPSYNLTSRSEVNPTQSGHILMTHLQMQQGHEINQGQGHSVSASSIQQQAQDFSAIIPTQPQASGPQFSDNEEQLYPGFYQETYEIENY